MRSFGSLLLAGIICLTSGCGGGGGEPSGGQRVGGAPESFFGVISAEPLPGDRELARLGRGGVGTLRINLAWPYVQSGPGAPYDWSHYDDVIAGAARNGIRVLATVYASPSWAEPSPEQPPLGAMLPSFEDFTRAAVQRYGSSGSFWRLHPDIPKLPIAEWELWNEPNSPLFWKPKPSAGEYLDLLRGFHEAVDSADPNGQILLGGLFPTPKGGIPMRQFLARIYQGGGRGLFNAVGIHPYAAGPSRVLTAATSTRRTLDQFDASGIPIWITEVGWASGGAPSGVTVGPTRQAAYLRRTFELAAGARERLNLAGVVWYALSDTPGQVWPAHCGLFGLDGSAKPAWGALVSLTGGSA